MRAPTSTGRRTTLSRAEKGVVYASVDEKEEESEDLDADYVVDEKAKTPR